MLRHLLRTRVAILCLTILAIGLAGSRDSMAGKPSGGGGIPAGRIYYTWGSEFGGGISPPHFVDRGDWSMKADGSDKRMIYVPWNDADLSYRFHQGHRWFLMSDFSLTSPGYGALFAVRDDGNLAVTVQLVDKTDWTVARWAKDDTFVSFVTRTNDIAEIWVAEISFDVNGLPVVTVPPTVFVAEPQAIIRDHNFSPWGDEVAYQFSTGGADSLVVKDLMTGATRVLSEYGETPAWSPDGALIAFRVRDVGIHVIRPDGTGLLQLTSSNVGDYLGDWSPDSQHIVFNRLLQKNGPSGTSIYSGDVLRVSVTGGGSVTLTKDIDGTAGALFWRQ